MRERKLAAMLIAAALVVGCNKDESTSTTPTTPAQPAPSNTSPAAAKPSDMPKPPPDAPTGPPTQFPSSPVPATPGAAANDATKSEAVTKANQLLQEGLNYVKENKMDLAEKTLTQLEGMKAQLPADWAPKIEQLRSAIQAAKMSGGKLPGMK